MVLGAVTLVAAIWMFVWLVKQPSRSQAASVGRPAEPAPGRGPTVAPVATPAKQTIFLSYASEDRPRAERVARALTSRGWSVWWDRTIPPGKSFDDVIEAALNAAKCVVVLWSKASVTSEWVKTEATEGANRRILVPALIDDVPIPLAFKRIHAANLIGWNSEAGDESFASLAESVSALVAPAERP